MTSCRRKEDAGQEDEARGFLLDKATVKCMRGLLVSMMGQRQKVEAFKTTLSDKESINIVIMLPNNNYVNIGRTRYTPSTAARLGCRWWGTISGDTSRYGYIDVYVDMCVDIDMYRDMEICRYMYV